MINKQIVARIEKEIKDDKRTYLQNCRENYEQYIKVAQILFKDFYEQLSNNWDPYIVYISKAIKLKEAGHFDEEKNILVIAVNDKNTYVPYPYQRLAIIYSKEKNYKKAYDICKKWFDSVYWKIPNAATTSLALLDRMEKLEKKLNK